MTSWIAHLGNIISLAYGDFLNATVFHKSHLAKASVNITPKLIRKVRLYILENDQASRTDSHLSLGYDSYRDIRMLSLTISLTGCLP